MEGKIFDVRLIPEFSGAVTDMPIVEWVENVELVCELFAMKNVECVLPLRLQGGAFAVYRQLSAEQKADAEQIKQALITAYAADAFNAYDQFVTRKLRPGETVDEFFAELLRLARLVGGPLPECWLTCTFVSGLPQHIKHLRTSSRIETMSAEQLLTRARAVMTDNEGPAELAAASASWTPSESKMCSDDRKFACYRCGGPNLMAKDCLEDHQEKPDSRMCKVRRDTCCYRCSGLGHVASQCQGNAKGEEASASVSSPINWTLGNFPPWRYG